MVKGVDVKRIDVEYIDKTRVHVGEYYPPDKNEGYLSDDYHDGGYIPSVYTYIYVEPVKHEIYKCGIGFSTLMTRYCGFFGKDSVHAYMSFFEGAYEWEDEEIISWYRSLKEELKKHLIELVPMKIDEENVPDKWIKLSNHLSRDRYLLDSKSFDRKIPDSIRYYRCPKCSGIFPTNRKETDYCPYCLADLKLTEIEDLTDSMRVYEYEYYDTLKELGAYDMMY